MTSLFAAGAAMLATMASAASATDAHARAEARLAKAIDGRTAGAPVDCIDLRDISSTEIVDRTAIIYRMAGNRVFINRPDIGAASLRSDDVLLTKTWNSRLCSIDSVQLIDPVGRNWHGFVGLGKFVPYAKPPAKS